MSKVAIHKYAGILSAYGMAYADVVHEAQEPAAKTYQLGTVYSVVCYNLRVVNFKI